MDGRTGALLFRERWTVTCSEHACVADAAAVFNLLEWRRNRRSQSWKLGRAQAGLRNINFSARLIALETRGLILALNCNFESGLISGESADGICGAELVRVDNTVAIMQTSTDVLQTP